MSVPSDRGIEADPRWVLRLFGAFELRSPAGHRIALPGKRERLLLAYLALTRNHRQTRAKLALLLWGEAANETTVDNLRTCLWGLRKALGDAEHKVLASEGDDIVLDASRFDIDTARFERCSIASDDASLEAAARLYAGELLDGLYLDSEDFESWRRLEAQRYRDEAANVLLRLMAVRSESGATERAIDAGVALLRLDPLHEAAARRLMRLYRDRGRRGAALDVYRTLTDTLKRELAVEPEAETRAVFMEIGHAKEPNSAHPRAPTVPSSGHDAIQDPVSWPEKTPRPGLATTGLVTSLVLATAAVAYWLVATRPVDAPAPGNGLVSAAPTAGDAISIVVLPFTNLSGDPSQEFFSDGMTEEVTTALAKVPNLRVVARTSAFQFKGGARDVRLVAEALDASHLVEGAVRRDGARVRVNAQLIEAGSGMDLWTDSYDREFDDMFAVQDEIAEAIAEALRIPLGLQPDRGLTAIHIGDVDTYQKFVAARAMVHQRGYGSLAEGTTLLEGVVASDPDYAPAWAYLAQGYIFALNYDPAWISGNFELLKPRVATLMPRAEAAARRAIALDPSLADGYALLGLTLELRGQLAEAEDLYRRAMVLDPSNPDVLHFYSRLLSEVGYLQQALAMRQRLQALDPFVPIYNSVTAWLFWLNGETDRAIALSESVPPFHRSYTAPQLSAALGRYDEAADLIASTAPEMLLPGVKEAAADLIRSAPRQAAAPEGLPRLGWFNFVYAYVGALDRMLEFYEDGLEAGYSVSASNMHLWHSRYADLRKTERYKSFMRKRGIVEYWEERGWPDLCRPIGSDDFICN